MDSRPRVVVFGDVIDDIVVRPTTEIREDTDTPAAIERRSGGSAANTAAWIGRTGRAHVDFVGRVGAPDVTRHVAELASCGVVPHLEADTNAPTGTIVVIVHSERGVRTMLTDRGASAAISPDDLPRELLTSAAVLHFTGHALFGRAGSRGESGLDRRKVAAVGRLIADAHAVGARVTFDPGSAGFIADVGADAFLDAIAGVDVVFPNAEEARELTGETHVAEAARVLRSRGPLAVVTCGERGAHLAGIEEFDVPAVRPHGAVIDPTGAGDAFAAGFLADWAANGCVDDSRILRECAVAGARVALGAVALVGGRPQPESAP